MPVREAAVATLKHYDIGNLFSLSTLPKASVLVPLFVKNGELHTLMTLRSKELRTSGGEVCFPGGKRDPNDRDDVHTALREAEEEIGLPVGEVEVVCSLFPIMNKSGLLVTPVVGFIEESFCPCPNPAEVSAVFSVPLDFFTSDENHVSCSSIGTLAPMHSFCFSDPESGNQYHIWGLTAMIAILVSVLALRKKPKFDIAFDTDDPFSTFRKVLHMKLSKL
ncbi:peroxisomal coenzyme A diphosphatase NUDT7 [Takifugu flavidus]|nr:peroxisomal coenzyme A diphosphatase NUDT7 [Takifugu flavidus]